MARKRNLAAAVSAAKQDEPAPTDTAPATRPPLGLNPMAARQGVLADVASGKVRDVRLRLVDPKTCRMWKRHNRLYDLLTPENCDDLISSIRAQGKQEIPALVRKLKDDPDGFEYEVVSGARRHFAVSYLQRAEHRDIPYLIEVRDLQDEEAFRYSDLENRSRQDVSDYERGREYEHALRAYYEGNQKRMANRMEMSEALLSSYLSVARLPEPVLAAYGDPRQIAVRHGQMLNPLLKGEERSALLMRAKLIAEAQSAAKARSSGELIPGAEVFKMLQGERVRPRGSEPTVFRAPDGKPILTAKVSKTALVLKVDPTASEDDILDAVREVLRTG